MTERKPPHKVMTAREYLDMPIIGWHEVCRQIDGQGGVGVRYLGDEAEEPCCRDCRFRKCGTMECHRHAPLVTGGLHGPAFTVWPEITDSNWCGDFERFKSE